MADKHIYIDDSPKNPDLKTSPFDWTYTTNLTGRFGKVNCCMMKYLPPHSKLKFKPYFGFDMHSLVYPVQTNIRCHLKFYKVPLRILWKDAEDFFSQLGTNGLPTNGGGTSFVVPYIKRPTGWNGVGSLAEQIGCSNHALTGVSSFRAVDGEYSKGSSENVYYNHVSSQFASGSSSLFIPLPIGSLLQPANVSPLNGLFMSVSLTSQSNITYTSDTYTIRAYIRGRETLFHGSVEGIDHSTEYEKVAETSLNTFCSSHSSFNSSTTSCFALRDRVDTNINGNTLKVDTLVFKVVDDRFFQIVNNFLSQDVEVFLQFLPPYYRSYFFPNSLSVPSQSLVTFNNTITTEQTSGGSTKTVYTTTSQELINSLGLLKTVELGLLTVRSSVDTKFDSVGGADPQIPIPALPFRALEFIHNYFMRNPRIDPFIKDGVPTYNRFLTNDGSGADTTTPVDTWNALYESDYFTTCVKEPQFGNAPLVGATVNDTSDTGILTFGDGTTFNNYVVKLDADQDGNVAPLSVYPETADKPTMDRLNELIKFGISINDLRNVSTFQRMLERMQRTSYRFANVVYEFFGTNPPVGDHYPQYLGGVTRNVTVDKITNIAQSDNHPLGEFAGQGHFRGEGENITVFTTEPCYIVGIQYFTVTPTYSQYLPKHLLYKNPLDFYMNPEFAFMGPQPVYKGELAPNQVSAEHFYDVFGYNRPYAELFGNVDEVHGLYRTDMANFLLQRFFGDAPELNKSFIEINSADLTNIFSVVKNTDKLFGQIRFEGTCQLPAPRSYLPRSI